MYIADLLYQITMFLIILGVIYLIYRFMTNQPTHKDTDEMNEKLDRIIELLEDQNKHK